MTDDQLMIPVLNSVMEDDERKAALLEKWIEGIDMKFLLKILSRGRINNFKGLLQSKLMTQVKKRRSLQHRYRHCGKLCNRKTYCKSKQGKVIKMMLFAVIVKSLVV
jgi:hypothetical protein